MRQFEVTFIVDPVLPKDEVQGIANKYLDFLKQNQCPIVHVDEMGLRQLAYPINKRNSGVYYCIEFQSETGNMIGELELTMKRDERLLRFLTIKLDKYGVKYNEDKRAGKIGKKKPVMSKRAVVEAPPAPAEVVAEKAAPAPAPEPTPEPVMASAPAPVEAPVAAADDLKKVEGIGPKIEELLNNAGISTFAALAATEADRVREILAEAGSRFTMHDPTTWAQQAQLAADGNWDALKTLQGELQGGRVENASSEEE